MRARSVSLTDPPFGTASGRGGSLRIDDQSCALCVHYFHTPDGEPRCRDCPLALVRGGVPCDVTRNDETISPYEQFVEMGDAWPMLRWLRAAAREQRGKTRKGR